MCYTEHMTHNETIIVQVHTNDIILEMLTYENLSDARTSARRALEYYQTFARSLGEEITVDICQDGDILESSTATPY